jgi:hypothetical protein
MRCLPACSTAMLPAGCPHLQCCTWTCNFHPAPHSVMLLVQTQADLDNKHQLAVAVFQVATANVHGASGKVLYSPDGRRTGSFRKECSASSRQPTSPTCWIVARYVKVFAASIKVCLALMPCKPAVWRGCADGQAPCGHRDVHGAHAAEGCCGTAV